MISNLVVSMCISLATQTPSADPVPSDGTTTATNTVTASTLFDYLKSSGTIGVLLLILSVIAVAIMIKHFIQVQKEKLAPPEVVAGLSRLLKEGDIDTAIRACQAPENDCVIARIFARGLTRGTKSAVGMLELRTAVEEAGVRETDKLYRQSDIIGLIAALGPMLGLLGTVFGMIGAFGSISSLEGAARSRELAGFMAMALVNTAEGLAVAIPCTAAYSIMRRRIESASSDLAEISEELITIVAPGAAKVLAGRPLPKPPGAHAAASSGAVAGLPQPLPRPFETPRT